MQDGGSLSPTTLLPTNSLRYKQTSQDKDLLGKVIAATKKPDNS
jgi:hypothetical protein